MTSTTTTTRQLNCAECGAAYTPRRITQEFCCTPCAKSFNNRRMVRGAQLYDLFMVIRFDRSTAKAKGLWSLLCRLAMYWREDDLRKRNQERSWKRLDDALDTTSWARATVVNRNVAGQR